MIFVFIFIAVFMIVFSIYIHRGFIYPIAWTTTHMTLTAIGLYLLDSANKWYYIFGIMLFLFGYWVMVRLILKISHSIKLVSQSETAKFTVRTLAIWITSSAVFGLVGYHFAVGGIPLFSDGIEIDRFNFTSSGLFGIPGRMYMMGLPLLLVYISIIRSRTVVHKSINVVYVLTWVVFITSRIFSGFKGSLLEVVLTIMFIHAIENKPISVYNKRLFTYALVLFSSLLFAGLIAGRYGATYGIDFMDSIAYLLDRMTTIAAQPAEYVMSAAEKHTMDSSYSGYYFQDFAYILKKYLRISLVEGDVFTLEKTVSAGLYGVPLSEDYFIVPVTIGAFAETFINFGLIGTYFVMFFYGILYAYFIGQAIRSTNIYIATLYGYGVLICHSYLTKGGLIYFLTNGAGILFLFFGLVTFLNWSSIIFRKY